MRIVVVGIGGVGMAHICAAGRLGLEVVGLIDTDCNILDKAQKSWKNEWGGFVEEVEVQPNTVYSQDIRDLEKWNLNRGDLIILATPPHTHKALIRICLDFSKATILVEKPISNEVYYNHSDRLAVSAEWVFHDQLKVDIQDIEMAYPSSQTTHWGYILHPLMDFSPHLFSIILSKGYEILFTFKKCILPLRFEIGVSALKGDDRKNINLMGERRSDNQGLFINGQKLDWQENLFDLQLAHIQETGKGGVPWQEMLSLENQVRKFLL